MESFEVMQALREHAKTLGWQVEWEWKGERGGEVEYSLWIRPIRGEAGDAQ